MYLYVCITCEQQHLMMAVTEDVGKTTVVTLMKCTSSQPCSFNLSSQYRDITDAIVSNCDNSGGKKQ